MKTTQTLRNHAVQPESDQELIAIRLGKWKYHQQDQLETLKVHGKTYSVRSGLTFTPFANPTKCNSHCRFCSEELQRTDQQNLTSKQVISNHDLYFRALKQVFKDLSGINRIGLSLSGLEATSDPKWLHRLLDLIHENSISLFDEKVLYTNSTGLYKDPSLIDKLAKVKFDRLEISRCHYDEEINQRIMYFNRNEPVYQNAIYERLIGALQPNLKIRNSCILTRVGISTIEGVENYLEWKISLGVQEVVFRELSKVDDAYINNPTKRWVEANRISIDPILTEVMSSLKNIRSKWQYSHSKAGYYYYNECYRFRDKITVVLETSSYNELINRNKDEAVQKLIFHSNGNLCGDWDPDSNLLGNYFNDE